MFGSTTLLTVLIGTTLLFTHCGKSSSDDSSGTSFSSNQQNVSVTITSQAGTPTQMKGWMVALMERDSGLGRVAEADGYGILKWGKVNLDATHTAVLLSPDLLIQSIMAIPSSKANTIKQYFTIGGTSLPQLVQKGSGLTFQTTTGITVQDYYATNLG